MCVIFIVTDDKLRPTPHMIEKAWERNDDGGGIAHREGDEVVWEKGLSLDDMQVLCAELPVPYIPHFRTASSGGVRPSLTHPFPIDNEVSLALSGRTKGCVLFHNGDWKEWAYDVRDAVRNARNIDGTRIPIPVGKWSDSRGMAFLCSIFGLGYMELLNTQKGVAFGPKTLEVYVGTTGWIKVNVNGTRVAGDHELGVWCSNDHWISTNHYNGGSGYSVCTFGSCRRRDNLDVSNRCPQHPKHLDGVVTTPHTVIGTPAVSPAPQAPFRLVAQGTPATGPLISLETAEMMHKQGSLSKNLLKAIRKAYTRVDMGGKEAEKAKRALATVSHQLFLNGRPH